MFGENVRLAFSSLRANKLRSFLTMLGIIIGTGAVIAILTVGNSLTSSVYEMMQSLGANDIFIMVRSRSADDELSADDIASLNTDGLTFGTKESTKMQDSDYISADMIHELAATFKDEIYAVNITNYVGTGKATGENGNASFSLMGTSVGFYKSTPIKILAGQMLSESDFDEGRMSCLLSKATAISLFGTDYKKAVGQTINIRVNDTNSAFVVRGVYEGSASQSTGGIMGTISSFGSMMPTPCYVPLKASHTVSKTKELYSYIQVSAATGTDPEVLSSSVKEFFNAYYRNNSNYRVSVITYGTMLSLFYQLLRMVTIAIAIIAGIALVVGGIGVMNIMLVSVTERTREIGTRKALGATDEAIRSQFLMEAVIICLIGGIIGVALGISVGIAATHVIGYPSVPSIGGIIFSLAFSMTIGLIFGSAPAKKAATMNPIDALRYE